VKRNQKEAILPPRVGREQTTRKSTQSTVKINLITALLVSLLISIPCQADILILGHGQIMAGDILQQNDDDVLLKMDSGNLSFSKSTIKDIRLTSTDGNGASLDFVETNRIPSWGTIVSALSKAPWANGLRQIPATVIDNGDLKDVPYLSFHCAGDCYEMNVYGDPDNPACIEIGAIKSLAKSERARSNCVHFVSSILTRYDDKRVARSVGRSKQIITNDDLTFEITLPDEPDAYGGWWISVYNESALEEARATGKDLLTITEPIVPPKPSYPTTHEIWTAADFNQSRPPSGSGGRVWVNGYTKKNGTYVSGYLRSAPHRH